MDGTGYGALGGLGLGILKSIADKTKQDQEKKTLYAETLLSPWTHMEFRDMVKPREANSIGTVAGAVAGGANAGQDYQNAQDVGALKRANQASAANSQVDAALAGMPDSDALDSYGPNAAPTRGRSVWTLMGNG